MITLDELRPLDSATDSVSSVQSGVWTVGVNSLPADIDIRDLAFATDSVTAHQGGSWTVAVSALPADVDIRDLSHLQDSVKVGDGTNFINIDGANGGLDVNIKGGTVEVDDVSDALLVTKKSITTTSALLVATNLSGRRKITIQNLGSQDVYINNTTATVDDIKIPAKSSAEFFFSDALNIAAITAAGTADVRIMEEAQA